MRNLGLSLAVLAAILIGDGTGARAGEPFKLSIMTFNVNDLPPPLRKKASTAMKFIGQDLARRQADGTAPDVVFLQEAFTRRSGKLVRRAGYPHVVKGPSVRATSPQQRVIEYGAPADREPMAPRRNYNRLVSSGLYILSKFPLVRVEKEVYGNDCSGSDCFANKGMIYAEIEVPGQDARIAIATTHMDSNTRDASRKERFAAHWSQTGTLMSFLDRQRRGRTLILAGDLNIRDDKRYAHFIQASKARNAGEDCVARVVDCAIDEETIPATLTRETNDFHFILDGSDYDVSPVAMARTYREKIAGARLSDHLAFEATYVMTPK